MRVFPHPVPFPFKGHAAYVRFPQEIVTQTFLPTYRALLARSLSERGLAQERIAALVGVSQAQVSKYLAAKVELEPTLAHDERVTTTVERVAGGLADGSLDVVGALAESLELIRRLENRGPLCELHEALVPELKGTGCDACIQPGGLVMAEHHVLTTLRQALRRLQAVPGLAAWVPHVGSNLAQARDGAMDAWDVAALPGRIDVVGQDVRITTEPTFGASRHVAAVVLAVADVHPSLRAALNLAYRPGLEERAAAAGLGTLAFEPTEEGDRAGLAERLRAHAEVDGPAPGLLYHEGAFGIEPVAYLVAEDAAAVVTRLAAMFK